MLAETTEAPCKRDVVVYKSAEDHPNGHTLMRIEILHSSFTGGPRYQHQLYQDAMGIVHCFGKPDFFVTFTCNPRWQEITDALLPRQTAEN